MEIYKWKKSVWGKEVWDSVRVRQLMIICQCTYTPKNELPFPWIEIVWSTSNEANKRQRRERERERPSSSSTPTSSSSTSSSWSYFIVHGATVLTVWDESHRNRCWLPHITISHRHNSHLPNSIVEMWEKESEWRGQMKKIAKEWFESRDPSVTGWMASRLIIRSHTRTQVKIDPKSVTSDHRVLSRVQFHYSMANNGRYIKQLKLCVWEREREREARYLYLRRQKWVNETTLNHAEIDWNRFWAHCTFKVEVIVGLNFEFVTNINSNCR